MGCARKDEGTGKECGEGGPKGRPPGPGRREHSARSGRQLRILQREALKSVSYFGELVREGLVRRGSTAVWQRLWKRMPCCSWFKEQGASLGLGIAEASLGKGPWEARLERGLAVGDGRWRWLMGRACQAEQSCEKATGKGRSRLR